MTTPGIDAARLHLIASGYRCLSGGKFGLPSYSHVEAWAKGSLVVYMLSDAKIDGWDLLAPIDRTNTVNGTWAALDALESSGVLGTR